MSFGQLFVLAAAGALIVATVHRAGAQAQTPVPAVAVPSPTLTPVTASSPAASNTSSGYGPSGKDLFDCIVGSLNFIVVIVLLIWAVRDRRRQSQREAHAFWVQTMILEPKLPLIEDFFDACPAYLEPLPAGGSESVIDWQERATIRLKEFKTKLSRLRSEVVSPLTWVHAEFNALDVPLNRIQELVAAATTIACEVPHAGAMPPEQEFRRLQCQFFKTLICGQAKSTHVNIALPHDER